MFKSYLMLLWALPLLTAGANKKETPIGSAGDEYVELKADIYTALDEVHKVVEGDMPPGIVVVKVSIKPRGDDKLKLDLDQFQLLSYKDGQKSAPYTPAQIAGNTTMSLKRAESRSQSIGSVGNGPVWGGLGGTRVREMPGTGGGVGNSGQSDAPGVEAGKVEDSGAKESPLLKSLQAKQLKEGTILDWTSGLLYFPLEGKQKLKDLVLLYKSPAGRLVLAFGR